MFLGTLLASVGSWLGGAGSAATGAGSAAAGAGGALGAGAGAGSALGAGTGSALGAIGAGGGSTAAPAASTTGMASLGALGGGGAGVSPKVAAAAPRNLSGVLQQLRPTGAQGLAGLFTGAMPDSLVSAFTSTGQEDISPLRNAITAMGQRHPVAEVVDQALNRDLNVPRLLGSLMGRRLVGRQGLVNMGADTGMGDSNLLHLVARLRHLAQ